MNVVEHLLAGIVPHRYTARVTLVDSDSLMSLFLQSEIRVSVTICQAD
jgi:hypothetical protein